MHKGMVPCLTPVSSPPNCYQMVGFVSETVYLSFNNAAPPQWKSFEGWNRRASLITPTSISSSLSFHSFLIRPLFVFFFPPSIFSSCFARRFSFSISRSTSKSYGHGTSSPGMFHSDFPKFSMRCQTIVDWIGLFTLSFFLFSLSLSEREGLGFFSREIRRCSLSFILTLPFTGESPIGSRLEGESVSNEVHEGMENFRGRASRGNKLKTQVNGVYVFFNYVFARGKSLFRVTATLHKAVLRRFFFIGSNIQQFVESTTKVVAFFRSFFPVQSLLPVAHKVPQRLWLDSAWSCLPLPLPAFFLYPFSSSSLLFMFLTSVYTTQSQTAKWTREISLMQRIPLANVRRGSGGRNGSRIKRTF